MSILIVTLPAGLSSEGVQIAVHADAAGPYAVDVRPANSNQQWTPVTQVGGTTEVR